jgi:hypothetical protein
MINMPPPKRNEPPGFARDLNLMKGELSKALVAIKKSLSIATGHPPGSKKLSTKETLQRLDRYEYPESREELKKLSDGELVSLVQQAIKAREAANNDSMQDITPQLPTPEGGAIPQSAPSTATVPTPPSLPVPSAIAPAPVEQSALAVGVNPGQ